MVMNMQLDHLKYVSQFPGKMSRRLDASYTWKSMSNTCSKLFVVYIALLRSFWSSVFFASVLVIIV